MVVPLGEATIPDLPSSSNTGTGLLDISGNLCDAKLSVCPIIVNVGRFQLQTLQPQLFLNSECDGVFC